ncbi:MAG: c-type cytochrome [Gemmatimonadota bacterium]
MRLVAVALIVAGCGGEPESDVGDDTGNVVPPPDSAPGTTLTQFELEHGIGPINRVITLGSPDAAKAARGQTLFETNCLTCHRLDVDFLAPALGQVTSRRSPTYILNKILNPTEMAERHPVSKELQAKFPTPMLKLINAEEDALALLEYLRRQGGAGE